MTKYLFLCSALKLLQLVLVSSVKRVSGRIFKGKSCRGVVKKRRKILRFKPSAAEKKQHANSSHVASSKTVLDSGFHALDSGIQVLYSSLCQWIMDSKCLLFVGFWIPWAVFRIPKPKIPNSRRKFFPEAGFHKNKLLGFRSPDFLTWSEPMVTLECCVLSAFLMKAFPTAYSVSEDYYYLATETTGTC